MTFFEKLQRISKSARFNVIRNQGPSMNSQKTHTHSQKTKRTSLLQHVNECAACVRIVYTFENLLLMMMTTMMMISRMIAIKEQPSDIWKRNLKWKNSLTKENFAKPKWGKRERARREFQRRWNLLKSSLKTHSIPVRQNENARRTNKQPPVGTQYLFYLIISWNHVAMDQNKIM